MKEYYKIGEISRLYGIGTDSLRYYEEIGLLKPRRDDNGYRMYSISDIRTLNILRELRSIGFSMQEIKSHLQDFDVDKTLALFRREISAIEEKISQLDQLKNHLTGRIAKMESHLQTDFVEGQVEVQTLPARKILKLSEQVYRDEDLDFVIKELQKKNPDQLYIIGNGNTGAIMPLEPISHGVYGHFHAVFCLVEDEETRCSDIEGEKPCNYDAVIPAGDYLSTIICGGYSKMPAAWNHLFSEMQARRLTACGDPMEFYIIDNHDTNKENEYITLLQIPVK